MMGYASEIGVVCYGIGSLGFDFEKSRMLYGAGGICTGLLRLAIDVLIFASKRALGGLRIYISCGI